MKHQSRRLSLLPLVLLSYSLACSGFQAMPPEPLPPLERISSQKQTVVSAPVPFEPQRMSIHVHPSNLFSYEAPLNWRVDNLTSGVIVSSPDATVLSISLIHTGYKLSNRSFLQLASNTEQTNYASLDDYQVVTRHEDKLNHQVFVKKTYLQNGVEKIAISTYLQIGRTMYISELVGDGREITTNAHYDALYASFTESIHDLQTENMVSSSYLGAWTFKEAADRFSMQVPLGFQLLTSHPQENLVITQFRSPDDNATIESVFWDFDQSIALDFAADYSLRLVGASYAKGRDDIKVTSEIILGDGNAERISWVSRSGGYAGVIYFEVRDRQQMIVLSMAWNRLFDDIYWPVMETAASTFNSNPPLE